MNQPDFTKLFFDHFGGKPRQVKYEIRPYANVLHDLAFMTSLIHDARLIPNEITIRGSKMNIPLERDCWEIPRTSETNELHIAKSKLIFSSVENVQWEFDDLEDIKKDQELWVDYLYFDENFRSHHVDRFNCLIAGEGWRLRFTLNRSDFTVKLQDQEAPHLYVEKS